MIGQNIGENNWLGLFGYICTDCILNGGLTLEKIKQDYPDLIKLEEDDHSTTKITLAERYHPRFYKVVEELKGKFKAKSGGGGENSRKALELLGNGYLYFDTCKEPVLQDGRVYGVCEHDFAGYGQPCTALVMNRFGDNSESRFGDNSESISILNGRGDLNGVVLPEDFMDKLVSYVKNHDMLVNSISCEEVGNIIAKNIGDDKNLYTLITKYLNPKKRALHALIERSNGLFFSANEFYWLLNRAGEWNARVNLGLKYDDIRQVGYDARQFARVGFDVQGHEKFGDYHIGGDVNGFVSITLGEHGAVVHDAQDSRDNTFWVGLEENKWACVQSDVLRRGQGSTASGDFYIASTASALKDGELDLEGCIKFGSAFVVNNVLNYKEGAGIEDYVSRELL